MPENRLDTPEKAMATKTIEGYCNVYFAKFDQIVKLYIENFDDEYIKRCLKSFFNLEKKLFSQLELFTFNYYKDVAECVGDLDYPIDSPAEIWQHIQPSYIYLEQSEINKANTFLGITLYCDWDEEHGLYWSIKNNNEVVHVSPNGEYSDPDEKVSYEDGNYAGN